MNLHEIDDSLWIKINLRILDRVLAITNHKRHTSDSRTNYTDDGFVFAIVFHGSRGGVYLHEDYEELI